jgi:prophage regulatory protein
MSAEIRLRLLRLALVLYKTGLSRSSLYEKIASGDFPKPVRLGTDAKSVAWPEHEVDAWIRNMIHRRDGDVV